MDLLDDPAQPAIIVIDGKGTWASALQRFAVFAPTQRHHDRIRIINPQDIEHPTALNVFKLPDGPPAIRDAIAVGVSENLNYIFGSRDYELSAKMETAFTYAAQIVFSMPNPSMETLLGLFKDAQPDKQSSGIPPSSPYRPYIEQMHDSNREFMAELFYHPTEYGETKRQILNRIYNLLNARPFNAMFRHKENTLDMLDIMENGRVLIVDSSISAVGEKAAASFGRYVVALALSTARSRVCIPRSQWRPVHIFIDEAQMFADEERTEKLLQQVREFNVGVIQAHQKLDDLSPKLRATFAGNTAIKYAAAPSPDDAREMAKSMRCKPEFIMDQPLTETHTSFACYVDSFTPRALSYTVPFSVLYEPHLMIDAAYETVMRRNREIMSPTRVEQPKPFVRPEPPTEATPKAKPTKPVIADDPDDF